MSDYILEMKNITKVFPGVKALDDVNLKVRRGEIHCLVGENGAGKSTLMKVLSGVYGYGTYTGDILFDGEVQRFKGIADSEEKGIAIIYQELALIPELSVYENIYFGHEIMKGNQIDWNETIVKAGEMLRKVRLNIDPSTKIKNLGVGNQQLVEIAKALSKDVKLLILDEPTASLNEDDSENLLELLKQLKRNGVTCIMISHKLKEVTAIADTITVLRDGKTISTKIYNMDLSSDYDSQLDDSSQDIKESDIIRDMVGREIDNIYPVRETKNIGKVALSIKNWTVYDPIKGREILHHVNMDIREGEIVALQGLMGAGRTELAHSIFGNTPGYKITSGTLTMDGKQVNFKNPKQAIKAGLAYVSEDRKGNGLILIQDIKYNTSIANLEELTKGLVVNENEEIKISNYYKQSINIKAPSIEQKVGNLSGGNQQKVQLAKWMFVHPKVLILDEPTRGIDVGAKHEIYTLMNRLVSQGMSILMISSELPEVLGMCDRLYVMSEGTIKGELSREEATEEKVMAMAIKSKEV